MTLQSALAVTVTVDSTTVETTVTDSRPEIVTALVQLTEAQRRGFVTAAWTVGLRAILNAHRNAEEARLADIGKSMLEDVDRELQGYVTRQRDVLVEILKRYFDPKDGQVAVRIEGFLRNGGELTRAMEKYLAPEHGALARALASELGANSPPLKRLSPTDHEGIVHVYCSDSARVPDRSWSPVTKALDPLQEDGAVVRFLGMLRRQLEQADNDRTKQLATVMRALDANDEQSLLSRLMRETQAAWLAFVTAMNSDEAGSPLAVLKSSLQTLLEKHAKSQAEVMAGLEERQQKLDQYIRESVARLEERRRGDASSVRGGATFEDSVLRFMQRIVQGAPLVLENVGNVVGALSGRKVGDHVLRVTPESLFFGSALVVEAKHDASYSVTKALAELEVARSNRNAQVGLFVMARSLAPAGFPAMARYGCDILVTWDADEDSADPYLHAAVIPGLALASRQQRSVDSGNVEALADIEHRVHLDETMRKLVERIRKDAEELGEELRKGDDKLALLLRKAKETLKALNVELVESAAERGQPLLLEALGEAAE